MTFDEWVERHGIESARRWFNVGDHLVLIVYPGRYVTGTCGRWHGSEPLGNPTRNPTPEVAKQRLRDALCNCFDTEETIVDNS
jgi:hypothetical protein